MDNFFNSINKEADSLLQIMNSFQNLYNKRIIYYKKINLGTLEVHDRVKKKILEINSLESRYIKIFLIKNLYLMKKN
jgi:hypothetical protein